MRSSTHAELVRLMEAATAVALCVLLGNLRLVELPSGGSISLAAVPLLAYAAVRGGRSAVLACWCAGTAHALSGGTIIHPAQLLLDYVVAYGVLAAPALTGARTALRRTTGIVIALLAQLAVTTVSGVIFFSSTISGAAAWRYSLGYNAATVIPELALALLAVPVAIRALERADPDLARNHHAGAAAITPRRQPRIAVVQPRVLGMSDAAALPRRPAPAPELPRRTVPSQPLPHAPAGMHATPSARDRAPLTRPAPFAAQASMPWRRSS